MKPQVMTAKQSAEFDQAVRSMVERQRRELAGASQARQPASVVHAIKARHKQEERRLIGDMLTKWDAEEQKLDRYLAMTPLGRQALLLKEGK